MYDVKNAHDTDGAESLEQNLQKLERYRGYKENWNGHGAKPFTAEILDDVKTLLMGLRVQPQISPIDSESIQMSYSKQNSIEYLEFEISKYPFVCSFFLDKQGQEHYHSIRKNAVEINRMVDRFYGDCSEEDRLCMTRI